MWRGCEPFRGGDCSISSSDPALKVCDINRLANAPGFNINLAAGDSLLHGPKLGGEKDRVAYLDGMNPLQHLYQTEDAHELRRLLGQQYHVAVGNPPYTNVSDAALSQAYRQRFASCAGRYQLSIPFIERFFDLAFRGETTGYVGMINASGFAVKSFGKRMVQRYLRKWELTHVTRYSWSRNWEHVMLFFAYPPETTNAIEIAEYVIAQGNQDSRLVSERGGSDEVAVHRIGGHRQKMDNAGPGLESRLAKFRDSVRGPSTGRHAGLTAP